MINSVVPDQTAPIGAVCSRSTLFASILNSSVMLGNYLQQTTSADDIFRCIFFLSALRTNYLKGELHTRHTCSPVMMLIHTRTAGPAGNPQESLDKNGAVWCIQGLP